MLRNKLGFLSVEAFTLAEVFHPVSQSKRIAFTLAEVLITLGILGVVAAMTIPTLIQNYQKKVVGTRLAQTFSILSQVIQLSETQYGEISTWNIKTKHDSTIDLEKTVTDFFEKYFVPHLKIVNNYGYTSLKDAGFSEYKSKSGEVYQPENANFYIIDLTNGTTLLNSLNVRVNSEGEITAYTDPVFFVDINGKQKPNILGRDLFAFLIQKNKLIAFGDKNDGNVLGYLASSGKPYREALLDLCEGKSRLYDGIFCTGLIKSDGWELKKDYPW